MKSILQFLRKRKPRLQYRQVRRKGSVVASKSNLEHETMILRIQMGESGAGSVGGDKGKHVVDVGDEDDDEQLECLVDLDDDIFIDDWFDLNFIDQVEPEVEIDIEEGKIGGEENENVQDTWADKRKTWWKTVH
ncbi:hypothetical protein L1987_15212 [Smallanthus sonchifolius]|uniref:Uncharacterized protein n=1 Tax=Smallanthus sonchifolius TaxID=185202 RepID=A0ACB9J5Y7_9ASTR|nr:hypothetical protein L1987_15212 [Smallanthus sonchifolius]